MKKIFTIILGTGCFVAMLLSGASKADGSCSLPWSLGCIAVAIGCALLLTFSAEE